MVSILKLTSSKSKVDDLFLVSLFSPKKSMELANKGVAFSEFSDWQKLARKALQISPFSYFWRRLALKYPADLVVKELPLFLEALDDKEIAEQARALLFSLPVKKLPTANKLKEVSVATQESMRVKKLLAKKKRLGEKVFYNKLFSYVVSKQEDGQISFSLENGEIIHRFSHHLLFEPWYLAERRIRTVFGPATFIDVDKSWGTGGINFFLLPDGAIAVKKVSLLDYDKINLDRSLSFANLS